MLQTEEEVLEWRTKVEEQLGLKYEEREREGDERRAAKRPANRAAVAKALAEGGDEAAAKA